MHQAQRKGEEYTQDEIDLLKTQDSNYLALKVTEEKRKIERLQASLHMTALAGNDKHAPNTRTVFVDEEDGVQEALGRLNELQEEEQQREEALAFQRGTARLQTKQMQELIKRTAREDKLLKLKNDLDIKRKLTKKGRHRKVRV